MAVYAAYLDRFGGCNCMEFRSNVVLLSVYEQSNCDTDCRITIAGRSSVKQLTAIYLSPVTYKCDLYSKGSIYHSCFMSLNYRSSLLPLDYKLNLPTDELRLPDTCHNMPSKKALNLVDFFFCLWCPAPLCEDWQFEDSLEVDNQIFDRHNISSPQDDVDQIELKISSSSKTTVILEFTQKDFRTT